MAHPHFAKNLGVGVGLRVPHLPTILGQWPAVDFFEIISENFMVDGGPPLRNLERILEHYPVVEHGVSLSIASTDPLDFEYLGRLKALSKLTKTPWFSDHLCWSRTDSHQYHDLLPVPYTLENAAFIADKARVVQDFMELPFALENLSSYVEFVDSQMPEWEFYAEVVERAGVYMMLDVNNVFVSANNHGYEPMTYLKNLPLERVIQVHVAGHSELENGMFLDTHDHHVKDAVWELYRYVDQQVGGVSTVLEWDDNFLSFEETLAEAEIARQYRQQKDQIQSA